MEPSSQVHNLSAALLADSRILELKTALYERIGQSSYHDSSEGYGAVKGILKAFEALEEWAALGKAAKLKELQVSPNVISQTEKKPADPDLEY